MTTETDAALNIRPINTELRNALKSEAKAAGKGLSEYCAEILAARKAVPSPVGPTSTGGAAPSQPAEDIWAGVHDAPVSGPGVVTVAKPKCGHGYLNAKLCPACRAAS
jgi:hypothetical protein